MKSDNIIELKLRGDVVGGSKVDSSNIKDSVSHILNFQRKVAEQTQEDKALQCILNRADKLGW